MAFYVELIKSENEDQDFVYYIYQFSLPSDAYQTAGGKIRYKSKQVRGKLKIEKRNGNVHTVELAEGENGSHIKRAGWALMRHWVNGEYPDKTYWIS